MIRRGNCGSANTGTLLLSISILLTLATATASAQTAVTGLENLYSDPKDDLNNALRYIASNTLTAIAFAIVMSIALVQTFYTFRYGARWMLPMVIGGYTYAIGFGLRFGLHDHPDSLGMYISEDMFIVLSPCAFIAANYILLGRLARHWSCTPHVLLPVRKLTVVFVMSDITTFWIQASGGGMSVSHDPTWARMGPHLASFTLFSGIYVYFVYRVYMMECDVWECDKEQVWYSDRRLLVCALTISCVGILVRSGYRVAEVSNGFLSTLATTESYFYLLDALPLVVATGVYTLVWPGWYITSDGEPEAKTVDIESKESSM